MQARGYVNGRPPGWKYIQVLDRSSVVDLLRCDIVILDFSLR